MPTPKWRRAANSQKCLRVSGKHNDLEEVGKDTYHHTFFEMLGNWSFNDYFKAEAIEWAWELLTKVWEIPPDKLWATVFAGDKEDGLPKDDRGREALDESYAHTSRPRPGVRKKRQLLGNGRNRPLRPVQRNSHRPRPGPLRQKKYKGHKCAVNAGCARFIELWNLVFIQYNRGEDGKLTPLGAKYVDTGAASNESSPSCRTKKAITTPTCLCPSSTRPAKCQAKNTPPLSAITTDNAFRVISDHIRALSMAITDGAMPSNEGRGYVIRRILRRASRFGRQLDMHEPFLYKLVPVVADCLGEAFPEIKQRIDFVSTVIKSEEESFGRTLDRGIEIFNDAADKAQKSKNKTITGDDAFQLYDTYGFPIDLTSLWPTNKASKSIPKNSTN